MKIIADITTEDMDGLKMIKAYFGENDKTPHEHMLYNIAYKLVEKLTIPVVSDLCCDYPYYNDSEVQLNTETCQNCYATKPKQYKH